MSQRIIFKNNDGTVGIIVPSPDVTVEQCIKDVPEGLAYEIVDTSTIPSDRTFRNAWKHDPEKKVDVDVVKAKDITHDRRRTKRTEEFTPHDEVIAKQIPGVDSTAAEEARANIRTKYDAMQVSIDDCTDADELKVIIDTEGI